MLLSAGDGGRVMNPRGFHFFGFFFLAVLAGCGSNVRTQSGSQQDKFVSTLLNVGKLVASLQIAGQRHGGNTQVASGPNASVTGGELDQDVEEMSALMDKATSAGKCQVPNIYPFDLFLAGPGAKFIEAPPVQDVEFIVTGPECPVALDFKLKAQPEGLATKLSYTLHYEARTQEIRDILDIDKIDVQGTLILQTQGFEMDAKWNQQGSIHSATLGKIGCEVKMFLKALSTEEGVASASSEYEFALKFADYTGKLQSALRAGNGKLEEEYFLDSEKLTADQFKMFNPIKGI